MVKRKKDRFKKWVSHKTDNLSYELNPREGEIYGE